MAGDTHWYVIIVGAYYPFIAGPICKNYLFSTIQHRWGYVCFIVIIIEVAIFFDVSVNFKVYCPGTAVLVFTFYCK